MAAGDFLIRSNSLDTATLPSAAVALDALWDTEVHDEGSAATYSAGTFTLTNTAPYLIIYSERFETADVTNNTRIEGAGRIRMNGVNLIGGAGEGYIRKSSGDQDMVVSGMYIYNATAGDTFVTRFYRGDSSTAGTVAREPLNGGVQIIELDSADEFANYSTSGTVSLTNTEGSISNFTTDNEDASFTGGASSCTIANAGRYFMLFTGTTSQ